MSRLEGAYLACVPVLTLQQIEVLIPILGTPSGAILLGKGLFVHNIIFRMALKTGLVCAHNTEHKSKILPQFFEREYTPVISDDGSQSTTYRTSKGNLFKPTNM